MEWWSSSGSIANKVLDLPVRGCLSFEEVIRENLDLGRPDEVQLLFDRKIISTTPGRSRTRVVTEGVIPSINVYYKNTRVKQYHKQGHALHTETTINNRDFRIGKRLHNLRNFERLDFRPTGGCCKWSL
jgi:hypothetical protein